MTINKTLRETEDLMMELARFTLGIPDTDNNKVRIAYGANSNTGSAPSHRPENSVCYVYVNPTDDGYGKQHHITYEDGVDETGNMTEVDEYTEEYAVIFSFYGNDAHDRARKLRDAIYGVAVKEFLWRKHIHPKPGIPEIAQTHEILNTLWVKRCDITITFYAYIRIERERAVLNIEEATITFKRDLQ